MSLRNPVRRVVSAPPLFDIDAVRGFINAHYLKNRTVVSRDIASILDGVERLAGLPVTRHRYRTGEEHGTWVVPPQWDVREAWVRDAKGRVIASYRDHPLFVVPYSKPGRWRVSKAELLAHTYTDPSEPSAFAYNWRLTFDSMQRLQDWQISLPHRIAQRLGPGPFEVLIDAQVRDGDMLVGEITLPGERRETIAWLADYCHPGQVNDSFSGLALYAQVMRALANRPQRRYTYTFLMFPETIGSSIHIAADPARMAAVRGAIFSEGVAWGRHWVLKASRKADTYLDLLASACRRRFADLKPAPFYGAIGNDELTFDSVQVGIPALSLQKCPYAGYHTSADAPSRLEPATLRRAYDIMLALIDIAERDRVCAFTHAVPFHMSRFKLFDDDVLSPAAFRRNRRIVYELLDGRRSLLAMAEELDAPLDEVAAYVDRMAAHRLIREVAASPWDQSLDEALRRRLRADIEPRKGAVQPPVIKARMAAPPARDATSSPPARSAAPQRSRTR